MGGRIKTGAVYRKQIAVHRKAADDLMRENTALKAALDSNKNESVAVNYLKKEIALLRALLAAKGVTDV